MVDVLGPACGTKRLGLLTKRRQSGKPDIHRKPFQQVQILGQIFGRGPWRTRGQGARQNLFGLFQKQRHNLGKIICADFVAQLGKLLPVNDVIHMVHRATFRLPAAAFPMRGRRSQGFGHFAARALRQG